MAQLFMQPSSVRARFPRRTPTFVLAAVTLLSVVPRGADAAGTPAGSVIENIAQVSAEVGGTNVTAPSNAARITVDERIDVITTSQSGQVIVSGSDADRGLLFTITNVGNGSEVFTLLAESVLPGDDFDPVPTVPAIYFDTDGSGDFSLADSAYSAGDNDPLLAPDESVDVLLVNDIPSGVADGNTGQSGLRVEAATGSGSPGDAFAGQGDGGVDAILGATGGNATAVGEYVVADVELNVIKTVSVSDQSGGNEPVSGATLTYTVTVEVTNDGIAANSTFLDPIPPNTTFVTSSISLNGIGLTDSTDIDAGELDDSSTPTIVIRLGDLTRASGTQTVSFDVTID